MNKILFCIVTILTQTHILVSQCGFENGLVIRDDSLNCCNQLILHNRNKSNHDTSKLKRLYYDLLYNDAINFVEFNQKMDTLDDLNHQFLYSGTESDHWKFRSKNVFKIRDCEKKIFESGYHRSIEKGDYLNASKYAGRLVKYYDHFGENKNQTKWKESELLNFQKYAADDYMKLIEFHKFWLLLDTTTTLKSNPPFEGYDYLVKTISKHHTKSQFETILEEGIHSAKIESGLIRGRPQFSLIFLLEGRPFEFYEDEISKLYFPDTTLIDTVGIFDCFGNDPRGSEYVEIQNITIINQIDNLNEMSQYKTKLRRSYLFGILRHMK